MGFGRVAQLVRALLSHSRGPGFESLHAHAISMLRERPVIITDDRPFVPPLPEASDQNTSAAADGTLTRSTPLSTVIRAPA